MAVVAVILPGRCHGEEASTEIPAGAVWTLQQCIDYAMANNLDIRQKQLSIDRSEVDIEARRGALFPSLSFATNQNVSWRPWSSSYVNITDGSMAATTSTVNYNGSYGFQSQWTVWNGGINRKQVERSRVALEQAETEEQSTRLSIQEQVVQLYVQILYQTEAVRVCREILESTQVQVERARAMYEVGKMSRADLAQVEAQQSQEEYNVSSANTQLADFKMQLRQLLELPGGTDFEVSAPTIDDATLMALLPSVDDVYTAAAATRPELRYNRLALQIADLDIDIARRGRYPTLSMMAGINTSASSGLESDWARQMKTNLSNSIGVTLSIPIFDNRQASTNIAQARIDRDAADVTLMQQQRQLYNSIETLWLNATNAREQYRYAVANVASMQESYTLVSEQFAVGLKDIVDLTTAKNNLVQAEQQMLQAKYTAVLNRALLNFYKGESLTLN